MFYAAKKTDGVIAVVDFDGQDCTAAIINEITNGKLEVKSQSQEEERLNCEFILDGETILPGEVIAFNSSGNRINADVYRICRFFDTKGSYGLIKRHAFGVIELERNETGYPTRIQCGTDIVELGEYVLIDKNGAAKKCSPDDYDKFQQSVD
jgi:hypothetical protein